MNEFKRGYQLKSNAIKERRSDGLACSQNTLNRQEYYFCYLLKEREFNVVRETEMDTAESLVSEHNIVEVGIGVQQLKKFKFPDRYID
jgi:hypothetical protein